MTNPCILFVEDNRISSLINCIILREVGYDVIEAFCAQEAVEIIDSHEHISALVTDINLGVGEDGFHVARYARAAYPSLPVVFTSAEAAARFPIEGVKSSEFVAKPCNTKQLMEALDRAMPVIRAA